MATVLSEPVWGGRLLFAGEACSMERMQCVDGALVTGRKAADHVLLDRAKKTPGVWVYPDGAQKVD